MRRVLAVRGRHLAVGLALPTALLLTACDDAQRAWSRWRDRNAPTELPALLTTELPFRYPPGLFIQRISGDVTLRLFVDSLGLVVRESTQVAEASAYAAFDSSALEGAPRLVFRPARRGERRVGAAVLFPIKFRPPGAGLAAPDTSPGRHR